MRSKTIYLAATSVCLLTGTQLSAATDWQYSLHAGAASLPRYSGSTERMTAPVLGANIVSPWGIFLDTDTGLGWGYEDDTLSFSAYVGASDGRKDRKKSGHQGSDRLKGMGTIKSRPQFGISASYTLGAAILGATLEHALEEDDKKDSGKAFTSLELSIGTHLYDGDYGTVDASLNSRFGDRNYVQTWYGVTPGQAARSRFRAYDAKGGMVSRGLSLDWSVPLGDHTTFSTLLDVQYLSGDAGKSPIVERRVQTSVMGVLNYTF
ncbi:MULTISPECIES: MipA/OmpV family protein [Pseudomonas]|uniref:MipA/OmpV family protein n=1 Tax=Pseudomonas TaxID=286 RepID=UPI000C07AFBA|nr:MULTISPECIES: MipA/OmpV family protein [Pseudomonas]NNA69417.1 MipA/OmpV family protein [Pseudomonas gessardii]PHN56456.1 structural protein MipA [Pseudomonas sp. ICMP 8385]